MKTIKTILYATIFSVALVSCERQYDGPPFEPPQYDGPPANITVAEFKNKYSDASTTPKDIDPALILKATVVGNDISGNIYKQLYLQDETGGIVIGVDQNSMYTKYRWGHEVFLSMKDLSVLTFGGEIQIGYAGTNANRIPWEVFQGNALLNGSTDTTRIPPTVVTIPELSVSMTNTLIQIDNIYFENAGKNPFAGDATTNETFKDADDNALILRTSSYADFAKDTLPKGTGTLIGVLGRYNGTWQFTIRSKDDVRGFTGVEVPQEEGTGTGTQEDPYDVINARNNQGGVANNDFKWVTGYIVGVYETGGTDFTPSFSAPFSTTSNIIIANTPDETRIGKCVTVQLPVGSARDDMNPALNPAMLGQQVKLSGSLEAYFSMPGLKNLQNYELESPPLEEGIILKETFGSADPSNSLVAGFTGYDMKTPIVYSDDTGNADIRKTGTTTPHVFFPGGKNASFIISGIDASAYTNITLEYEAAAFLGTSSTIDLNVISVTVNGTPLAVPSTPVSGSTDSNVFKQIIPTGSIPSSDVLTIEFRVTASDNNIAPGGLRLDNIILKGE